MTGPDANDSPDGPVDDAPDIAGTFLGTMRGRDIALSAAELAGAIALVLIVVLAPERPAEILARVAGLILVATSIVGLVEHLSDGARAARNMFVQAAGIAVGIWLALGGISRLALPQLLLQVAVVAALVTVAATGAVRVAERFGLTDVGPAGPGGSRWLLVRWVDARSRVDQDRRAIHRQLFFEGDDAPTQLGRFALMMLFASVIAAAGVVADSTAVVIGAMLIAPLITPMMGMALALVTGWPNRLGRSTLVMLFGFAIATGTGWIVAAAVNFTVDLETNTQITSRSSPTAIDLVIAIAAGSAGAYALSRTDVSSSLPGVAVSIALVPPRTNDACAPQGSRSSRSRWSRSACS